MWSCTEAFKDLLRVLKYIVVSLSYHQQSVLKVTGQTRSGKINTSTCLLPLRLCLICFWSGFRVQAFSDGVSPTASPKR